MKNPETSRIEVPTALKGQAQHYIDGHVSLRVFDQADVPFVVSRIFYILAPKGTRRGDHAHLRCHQYLIAVTGVIRVTLETPDGIAYETVLKQGDCLHVPPMHWAIEYFDEEHSVLLVLCDLPFAESDYLRERKEFDAQRSII
jgi:mannose-6-phosphate isomerase-like protein (cupin superfamily)